jgi:hypothetical protein
MTNEQLATMLIAAAAAVTPDENPLTLPTGLIQDMNDNPQIPGLFNEFGRLYAEATVPGAVELSVMYDQAQRYRSGWCMGVLADPAMGNTVPDIHNIQIAEWQTKAAKYDGLVAMGYVK